MPHPTPSTSFGGGCAVVPEPDAPWVLERFVERLDLWAETESPPEEIRLVVTEQIFTRMETPYRGVKRISDGDNLWFGVVPGSAHGSDLVVTWAYRVFESRRAVRCDLIETLSVPF